MQPIPFGRYLLLDKVAVGGMAELFLAKATGAGGFSKTCVIKRVLPHLADDRRFVQMFLDEARLAASLAHPGIVQIFDLGQEGGDYFLAMEYLAGEDLFLVQETLADKRQRMPVALAVWLIEQAAAALHHAHEQRGEDGKPLGIVHRDVSPSNLFLTYQGILKLLDFGIARAEARLIKTQPDAIKGKAGYTSPEHARGERVDRRTDVWSLGVCLHELLVGQRLFPGETIVQSALAALSRDIPPPSALRPEIPAALDAIVLSALQRDVGQRLPSAEALRAALCALRSSEPSLAQPVDPGAFLKELFGEGRAFERTNLGAGGGARVAGAPAGDDASSPPGTEALRGDAGAARGGKGSVPAPAASAGTEALASSSARVPREPGSPTPNLRRRTAAAAAAGALVAVCALAAVLLGRSEAPPVTTEAAEVTPPTTRVAPVDPGLPAAPEATTLSSEAPRAAEPGPPPEPALPPPGTRPRSRADQKPSRAEGLLSVESNAPVEVWVGRSRLGWVPLQGARVPAGSVQLRLVNAKLGLRRTARVKVRPGQETTHKAVFGKGELNVNVSPWADVWLDGEKLGQTPLAAREVWEGRHRLRLASPLGQKTVEIEVRAGQTLTVREQLP